VGCEVLAKAGLDSSDIDLLEINEAFGPFFAVKKKPAINAGLKNKLSAYPGLEVIL
jgi:hypothetical protein